MSNEKQIRKALEMMVKALVKTKNATPEKAMVIRSRLEAMPKERMVKVDLRRRDDIEAFILEAVPEWSEEWLLS